MAQIINFLPYLLRERPGIVEPLHPKCKECKEETCIGCPVVEETMRRC
jgi:hypothetical protein